MSSRPFLPSLQAYRGVAAMIVVFHHLWNSFSHFLGIESSFFDFLASVGKYGVDAFFVLSGFIISYSNFGHEGKRKDMYAYLIKRGLRVFVPYWPIGIFMLVAYFVFPGFSQGGRDISVVTSLFLVPHGSPALSVAWTLIHELIFYCLFSIWFFSAVRFNWFLGGWVLLILCYNYLPDWSMLPDTVFFKYFLSIYNLEFVLGYVACLVVLGLSSGDNRLSLLFSFLLFASFVLLKWNGLSAFQGSLNYLFSAACFFGILASVNFTAFRAGSLLLLIGNASYSIYLTHNPLISVLSRLFGRLDGAVMSWIALGLGFVLCLIFGYFYYLIVEKSLLSSVYKSSRFTFSWRKGVLRERD